MRCSTAPPGRWALVSATRTLALCARSRRPFGTNCRCASCLTELGRTGLLHAESLSLVRHALLALLYTSAEQGRESNGGSRGAAFN